jgi:hypothetical protein
MHGKNQFRDVGRYGRILLKLIVEEEASKMLSRLNWLRMRFNGGCDVSDELYSVSCSREILYNRISKIEPKF